MSKKYGSIRGLSGVSFLDDANFYLQNANYRNKLEKVCEKYGITPRLEPLPDHKVLWSVRNLPTQHTQVRDHILMWAEIGAALAEEHEEFAKRGRGRPKGKAGKPVQEGFMADEELVQFFEWLANEWGCSFDDLLKKGVDWAEQAEKISYLNDRRANLRRLKRVKEQMDKERLRSTGRLGLLSKPPKPDKKDG